MAVTINQSHPFFSLPFHFISLKSLNSIILRIIINSLGNDSQGPTRVILVLFSRVRVIVRYSNSHSFRHFGVLYLYPHRGLRKAA